MLASFSFLYFFLESHGQLTQMGDNTIHYFACYGGKKQREWYCTFFG